MTVTLTDKQADDLRHAASLVSMLLTDARITNGGLCSPDFVRGAQRALIDALAPLRFAPAVLQEAQEAQGEARAHDRSIDR